MNNPPNDLSTSVNKKRPVLLWVITIFYFFSAGYTLLSFALIYSGMSPLNEAQQTYFNSLDAFDIFFTVSISALNLAGAISLFLLKRHAFYTFLSAFILSMLMTVYDIIFKNWINAISETGLIGAIIGSIISLAIIVYARSLMKSDTLT